jgi:Flp pilus assembly pilin Flp
VGSRNVKLSVHGAPRAVRSEEGQGLVEYGLILALVTLVAIFSLTGPSGKMNEMIQRVGDSLTTVS